MKSFGMVIVGALAAACSSADEPAGSDMALTAPTPTAAPTPTTPAAPADLAPADLAPADWNVDALADSPSPGSEPINVILTTNVAMTDLVGALPQTRDPDQQGPAVWRPVEIGTGLSGCISEERATIDGAPSTVGTVPQMLSLRLSVVFGCDGVLADGESHARGWKSQARSGQSIETWYFALSQEHVCLADTKPWHCVLPQGFEGKLPGINGSLFTAKAGGYNQGRDQFVANLQRLVAPAGKAKWRVDCTSIERPPGEGLFVSVNGLFAMLNPGAVAPDPRTPGKHILKRVAWDNHATHCTIMQ
jgi:hypothetical protein